MIRELKKGENQRLGSHVWQREIDCRCSFPSCVITYVDTDLIEALDQLWEMAGAFWLSSGFRCVSHNKADGGKPGSLHLVGKAADIHPSRGSITDFGKYMELIPHFDHGGIGTYATFYHGDVRGYRARWRG